jgi:hypothetical protein
MDSVMRQIPLFGFAPEDSPCPPVEKSGYFSFPERVNSTNVFLAYDHKAMAPPENIRQYRDRHDYHVVQMFFSLTTDPQYRGAESCYIVLTLEGRVDGDSSAAHEECVFSDIGPTTEWKDKAIQGKIELGLDVGQITALFNPAAEAIKGEALLTYNWKPKVATVIASGRDRPHAAWQFRREEGTYLDGDNDLFLLIQRPREVKTLNLHVETAQVEYNVPHTRYDAVFKGQPRDVSIVFQESRTKRSE